MRARTARHFAIALALVAAGCGATGGTDRPERDATLMLDGPKAGVHAGIASAIARGYDEAEGVRLKLLKGKASPRTLTTGRADFAVLDLNELAGRRDVVAVMAIAQEPLLAYTTPRHAIRASWTRRFPHPVRRWDLARPRGERHVEKAGVPSYPELVLAVARATLADEPSVVRATVAALARGYRFALDDPASSEQDLGQPGALDRLDAALLGDAGEPGVLDTRDISAYARWAHTTFPVEPRYAAQAASADQG